VPQADQPMNGIPQEYHRLQGIYSSFPLLPASVAYKKIPLSCQHHYGSQLAGGYQ